MGNIMNRKHVYIIDNDAVMLDLYSELLVSDSYIVVPLANRYAQSIYNDNFDNGIFKGLFYFNKKLVK